MEGWTLKEIAPVLSAIAIVASILHTHWSLQRQGKRELALKKLDLQLRELDRFIDQRHDRALDPDQAVLQSPSDVKHLLELPLDADIDPASLTSAQRKLIREYYFQGEQYGRIEARVLRVQVIPTSEEDARRLAGDIYSYYQETRDVRQYLYGDRSTFYYFSDLREFLDDLSTCPHDPDPDRARERAVAYLTQKIRKLAAKRF